MSPEFKPIGILALLLIILQVLLVPLTAEASKHREHLVYFPNTVYELNVYKIYGKNKGKTLMLIGGIQGNEPGGFLSADLYADMRLETGNLIVVPRANFYSIILNQRGPNGDMNRKFTPEDSDESTEDKIVNILKALISESDYLLNLHDGAGYYYPTYLNKWRNPTRFGQSIIADCEEYRVPGTDKVIRLGEMAREVIEEVNPQIQNELYRFHFMNTRTGEKSSRHKEQQRSATYYALTKHHIPAFGIETSKFLPTIDLKVRYHNLVINAFKKHFGIIPESPGMILDPPELKYLIVSINNQIPVVIRKGDAVELGPGDTIHISHIEANYERGLSLDILGCGGLNDYRKDFPIHSDTTIVVRKDNQQFAEVPVILSSIRRKEDPDTAGPDRVSHFILEARGQRILLANGETLELIKGETIKVLDILPHLLRTEDLTVNFKGFVGDQDYNTGEDRGYLIDTADDLMEHWAKDGEYDIVATRGDRTLGHVKVRIADPELDYLVLKVNGNRHVLMRQGGSVTLKKNDSILLEEIRSNLNSGGGFRLALNGRQIGQGESVYLRDLCPSGVGDPQPVDVLHQKLLLGRVFIRLAQ